MDEFEVLRDIARELNTTNQRLGQILRENGYRDSNGDPTQLSRQHGWVRPYRLDFGGVSHKWHAQKVVEFVLALEARHPGTITSKKVPERRNRE